MIYDSVYACIVICLCVIYFLLIFYVALNIIQKVLY